MQIKPSIFDRITASWRRIVFHFRLLFLLAHQKKIPKREQDKAFQWTWLIPRFRLRNAMDRWQSSLQGLTLFLKVSFSPRTKREEERKDRSKTLLKTWLKHDWGLIQKSATPFRIGSEKLKQISFKGPLFRFTSILFGVTLGWTTVLIFVLIMDSTAKLRHSSRPVLQAAKYSYLPSTFYYPFSERGIDTLSAAPFTEDLTLGLRFNSHGFPAKEYTIAHPPKTFRILVIGDLQILNQGAPTAETFPYVLQNLLNRRCSNVKFEVIPIGGLGHRFADNVLRLLTHGQSLSPDLVIFQLGVNGVELYNYMSIFYLRDRPNFYTHWQKKAKEVMAENSNDFKIFQESVKVIQAWSHQNSIPVSFLMIPTIDTLKERGNFQRYNLQYPGISHYLVSAERIEQEIRKQSMPLLYMLEPFREKAGNQYLAFSQTSISPNRYAHQITAESLYTFLFQQNLVECSNPRIRAADAQWTAEQFLREEAAAKWKDFNRSYSRQLKFFKELEKLHPQDPWISSQLAAVYAGQQDWQNACKGYGSLADNQNGLSLSAYYRATCKPTMETKIEAFETMIRDVPDHTPSMELLAQYYIQQNRPQQACKILYRLTQIPLYEKQFKRAKKQFSENSCGRFLNE